MSMENTYDLKWPLWLVARNSVKNYSSVFLSLQFEYVIQKKKGKRSMRYEVNRRTKCERLYVGRTDEKDMWNMLLRWFYVARFMYQVSKRLIGASAGCYKHTLIFFQFKEHTLRYHSANLTFTYFRYSYWAHGSWTFQKVSYYPEICRCSLWSLRPMRRTYIVAVCWIPLRPMWRTYIVAVRCCPLRPMWRTYIVAFPCDQLRPMWRTYIVAFRCRPLRTLWRTYIVAFHCGPLRPMQSTYLVGFRFCPLWPMLCTVTVF
jgi:hypothetical protein